MKQITVTETVFTLDELSDTARRNALEKMSTWMNEWIEPSQITDFLNGELVGMLTGEYIGEIGKQELIKRVGLSIGWSLSYSQGDGVAIYGRIYAIDTPLLQWPDNATYADLTNISNHYTHENSFSVELFGENDEGYETQYDEGYTDTFAEQLRDICINLKKLGYQELENLTGEQAIIEHLEINDGRRFTENGDFAPTLFWSEQ
jgi:hypothetical protein